VLSRVPGELLDRIQTIAEPVRDALKDQLSRPFECNCGSLGGYLFKEEGLMTVGLPTCDWSVVFNTPPSISNPAGHRSVAQRACHR
jgi:hypothetical protein